MTVKRTYTQHAVIAPALCMRYDGSDFHAVTADISVSGLRLRSATMPRLDERLVCNIRDVGAINVEVVGVGACDFVIRVKGTNPAPGEIARRLIDLARQQSRPPEVVRTHRRIVPTRTDLQVTLEDGSLIPAQIVNLSASGVALRLDVPLAVGQPITIGQRRATVARQIERGIGAAFLEPLDDVAVSEHTVL